MSVQRLLSEVEDGSSWLRRETTDPELIAWFVVDGEPVSKERPRVVGGRAFTPAKTLAAEDQVAWAFRMAARSYVPPAEGSYGVIVRFFAATKRQRDVDNMLKLVLDALNKLAWADDVQVQEISARKFYVGKNKDLARTEVAIYSLPLEA